MKIKMLKPHLVYSAGETVEVPDQMANYWIGVKVAEMIPEGKETKKETKVEKTAKTTKTKAGGKNYKTKKGS